MVLKTCIPSAIGIQRIRNLPAHFGEEGFYLVDDTLEESSGMIKKACRRTEVVEIKIENHQYMWDQFVILNKTVSFF